MRKPTTGQLGPREPGPHGVTLEMRKIKRPAPTHVVMHETEWVETKGGSKHLVRKGVWATYVNAAKQAVRRRRTAGRAS